MIIYDGKGVLRGEEDSFVGYDVMSSLLTRERAPVNFPEIPEDAVIAAIKRGESVDVAIREAVAPRPEIYSN